MLIYLLYLNDDILSRCIQLIGLTRNIFLVQNRLSYFFIYKKNQSPKIILKMTDKEQAYRHLRLYKSLEAFYMKQL